MYSLLEWLYPPTHPVGHYGGTTQILFLQQLYLPEEIVYLVWIPSLGICWRLPTSPGDDAADAKFEWQYFMNHE